MSDVRNNVRRPSIVFIVKIRIWSHLLKKSVIENFIFCAVMLTKKIIAGAVNQNDVVLLGFTSIDFTMAS